MDMNWIATEAKTLHEIFASLFYVFVLTFLSLALVMEYFKLPFGGTPQFVTLIGRVFIAALLFVATPEIMNGLATFTDAITKDIGGFIEFQRVLDRMGDRVGELSWSWVSVKDSVLLLVSFLTFFILYLVVYFADAMFMFVWLLIYVMSPILIALFILPATAGATVKLYRSMIEVCCWKILWSVLSALLWSFAVSDVNQPEAGIDFLTAIILNLMLAYSVAMTPKITASFLGAGISEVASSLGGLLQNATNVTPQGFTSMLPAKLSALPAKARTVGTKMVSARKKLWPKKHVAKTKPVEPLKPQKSPPAP